MSKHGRTWVVIVCAIVVAMVGITTCREKTGASGSEVVSSITANQTAEIERLLGGRGTKIYELLKTGHTDVASDLLDDMDDSSPSAAVLSACQQIATSGGEDGAGEMFHRIQEQMMAQMSKFYGRNVVQDQSPMAQFQRASVLEPQWEPLWPHMAMDVLVTRLARIAAQGQSMVVSGDDVLISPDDRYNGASRKQRSVVVERHTADELMNPDASDSTDTGSRMTLSFLASQKHTYRHYFMGGTWTGLISKILSDRPGVLRQWQESLMAAADSFADHGSYSSCLFIKSILWELSGHTPAQILAEGTTFLESVADQATAAPESAHRLLVAIGYWGEAYADAFKEAAPDAQIKARLATMICNKTMPGAGVCSAVRVGHHLGLNMLEQSPTFRQAQEPWRDQVEACDCFEKAGATKDEEEAIALLQRAAMAGHAPAMEALAFRYYNQKNERLAFAWLTKAAKAGYPSSINNLGVFYVNGIGCGTDKEKALALYDLAASYGQPEALYAYGNLYQSNVHPMNLPVQITLCNYAAQGGCSAALLDMGWFYYRGSASTAKSPEKAVQCWQKAAELGMPEASYNMYLCCLHGEGTATDPNKAIRYLRAAANGRYSEAMYRLYLHYQNGTDVHQDSGEAMKWLRLASQHDHKQARQLVTEIERQRRANEAASRSLTTTSTPSYQYWTYRSPQSSQQDMDAAYQRAQEQAARQMRNYRYQLQSKMGAYGLSY
ncbi:MAG: sel1 repeat family protein [Sedimentisphaerales bacterium]|nr:sel1 repeat family protein [Sedimentisphaerales bacterium]